MKKIPVVLQLQQTECGLCCSNMILNYYGSRETIFNLRNEFEVGRDGLSLSQLKQLFLKKGFISKIYKADISGLKKLQLPAIIYWENKHFVVLEEISDKKIKIIDPAEGKRKLTTEEFLNSFSHLVLEVVPSNDFKPQFSEEVKPWEGIKQLVISKLSLTIFIILTTITVLLLNLIIPYLTQKIIDGALLGSVFNDFSRIIFSLLLISILHLTLSITRGSLIIKLNIFLSEKLMGNTFRHLLRLPFKFFDLRSPGDLLYRLNSLIGVRDLISSSLIPGIVDLGMMFVILIYLSSKSYTITLISLGLLFFNFLILSLSRAKVAAAVDNELVEQSKSQAILTEILFSSLFIKIAGLENKFFSKWEFSYKKSLEKFKYRSQLQNIINSLSGNFQLIAPVIILVTGIILYQNNTLTLGEIVAIQTITTMLFNQSSSVFSAYTQLILTSSYLRRVSDITGTKIESSKNLIKNFEVNGNIELEDVYFSYTNMSNDIIKNINLSINSGEKIAIVGKSGSGKSTLAKIIVGLYKHTKGNIYIDGLNINSIDQSVLHKQIGIVPQDIMLFNKSIFENITMGNEKFTLEDVQEAARLAMIDKEIENMPMQYNTVISDMGLNLSGGQRQRISLARALINKPRILILDEATSSLDQENEFNIMEYFKKVKCTVIIIAHRLSTIIDADKIYVIDDGNIIETGTHHELMNQGGFYYHLYNKKGVSDYAYNQ
ncbi:peptidase domain-containing ABC transporter (plasmid) [Bacillus thuringiensis]|uniref:peptidase domain-containing ABC transporter n=1 Tax=Bacillus thuringiensis TaxID=1428 RepID=UPI003BB1B578